jgi:hypothetical protein
MSSLTKLVKTRAASLCGVKKNVDGTVKEVFRDGTCPGSLPGRPDREHQSLGALVPQSLLAMITGGPILKEKSSAAKRQCQRLRRRSKPKKLRDVVIS